ncbi:hypothetical protein TNCT_609541 [Trichonephila clavata]|uniref:Uncharacterized protein n=1 Tax=Trichonephila clavata TaxID=2740835 RepID=A0A8X6GGJ0_TRICU|nr:hypothetical protein TNCT_609541 [Trichonephila clavata]
MIFVLRVCGLYHGANCTNGNPSPAGLLRGESIFDSSILTLWTEFAEERSLPPLFVDGKASRSVEADSFGGVADMKKGVFRAECVWLLFGNEC